MVGRLQEKVNSFFSNRWLVFVAAMWIQTCAGIGYLFGSISPIIKSTLGYNQKQLSSLGVVLMFKVYDSDGNGKVSFNDMMEVLQDLTGSFMSDKQREEDMVPWKRCSK